MFVRNIEITGLLFLNKWYYLNFNYRASILIISIESIMRADNLVNKLLEDFT